MYNKIIEMKAMSAKGEVQMKFCGSLKKIKIIFPLENRAKYLRGDGLGLEGNVVLLTRLGIPN